MLEISKELCSDKISTLVSGAKAPYYMQFTVWSPGDYRKDAGVYPRASIIEFKKFGKGVSWGYATNNEAEKTIEKWCLAGNCPG